jgi:hypothetical protein
LAEQVGVVQPISDCGSRSSHCRYCPTITSWRRGSDPLPDHNPSGRPIAGGPIVTAIQECLAVVESGKAEGDFGRHHCVV